MERRKNFQLELFTQTTQDEGDKKKSSGGSVYELIRRYEKGLFSAIGLVIIAIIAYSIGAHRGTAGNPSQPALPEETKALRQSVPAQRAERGVVHAQVTQPVDDVSPPKHGTEREAAVSGSSPEEISLQDKGSYTIQLASYKTRSYAEREAGRLKKKGYTPLILTKGDYIILCVGKFSSRAAAERVLKNQFSTRYQGCFARRL
ncbi:MAG: SPOR domain-containing protein [Candidatus Omnitrophica bacterium]|nr:SPOR domain-containing protein [Candidatus Omnitrophota bacterium]